MEEEYYCTIKEPNSEYTGNILVDNGSAKIIASGIFEFLKSKELETNKLIVLGCDDTVLNTGVKDGVLRIIELALNKALHRFVCQLNSNESPLRHICEKNDWQNKWASKLCWRT